MLHTPSLTDAQLADFERDGFLLVRGAFDAAETRQVDQWAQEITERPEESGKHWVFHETSLRDPGHDLISRIENISPFHPGFAELSQVLAAPVGQLLGEDAVLFKEKINFKMPGGDGFKPHQDSQAGWGDYADFFISVMTCIDEATIDNGCLQLVAKHHRKGLFREWEPLTDADMDGMDFVPYPTQPGDVVFFDCYAPHASEPNMTDSTRRLYFATYNRLAAGDHLERYYADKYQTYPPDIDRDPDKTYEFRV